MRRKSKLKPAQHAYIQAYHTGMVFMGQADAQRFQEWVDADPLNEMRARGRDVLDVRSLRFVQHKHPSQSRAT